MTLPCHVVCWCTLLCGYHHSHYMLLLLLLLLLLQVCYVAHAVFWHN